MYIICKRIEIETTMWMISFRHDIPLEDLAIHYMLILQNILGELTRGC